MRFQNYPKPGLLVQKVDSVTGDPLQGVKFHVVYASNNTFTGEINDLGYYYTDEKGQFWLDKLQDGWFKVTEEAPKTGLRHQRSRCSGVLHQGRHHEDADF